VDTPENKPKNKPKLTPKMIEMQWKPGQTGNAGGRPPKKPITEMYERIFSDPEAVALIEAAVRKSLSKGQMAMVLQLREMTDRVEGKVTQPIQAELTVNLADAIAAARKRAGK
jgi:hypothetical protein